MNEAEDVMNVAHILALKQLEAYSSIQSRMVDSETVEILRIAVELYLSGCTNLQNPNRMTDVQFESRRHAAGVSTVDSFQMGQLFETYIGTNSGRVSRLDLHYLVTVPWMVLINCLPAVRRADYLCEKGFATTVAVNQNSIVMPMVSRSSGNAFAGDIRDWLAVGETYSVMRTSPMECRVVDLVGAGDTVFLDDLVTDLPLSLFVNNTLAPTYTDPEWLYYNPLVACPALIHDYPVSYIQSF